MARKQEVQVAMVRSEDSKSYRVVSDTEILSLKISGKVTVEKSKVDRSKKGKDYFVTYYVLSL